MTTSGPTTTRDMVAAKVSRNCDSARTPPVKAGETLMIETGLSLRTEP